MPTLPDEYIQEALQTTFELKMHSGAHVSEPSINFSNTNFYKLNP